MSIAFVSKYFVEWLKASTVSIIAFFLIGITSGDSADSKYVPFGPQKIIKYPL